jgi:cell division protein FtsI (penicillin-binding protein 3)
VDQSARRRAVLLGLGIFGLFLALVARLYAIQIVEHDAYSEKSRSQGKALFSVDSPRGSVFDRNLQALAVSVPVSSVWANPRAISDWPQAARLLSRALCLREDFVRQQLLRDDRDFVWLKRKVTPEEADLVRGLLREPPFRVDSRRSPLAKIGLATEYSRRYPFGALFAHGLGHVSEDPRMFEGLERSLHSLLGGESRTFEARVDGRRQPIGVPEMDLGGVDVYLTIDVLLQKILEEELDQACLEHHPKWAAAVAMDPRTGAVLALGNRPAFDPNEPSRAAAGDRLNRSIGAPYEPGSTLKPFVAAFALEAGLIRPETKIDCENGLWRHGPRTLRDAHPYGILTLAEVIAFSSNIGAAKLGAFTLGPARLYECMRQWGFGTRSGIELPAEDSGRLIPLSHWTVYSQTSLPMGHEITVTPLQLVTAMSAIANGGTLYRPFLVRRVLTSDGVIQSEKSPEVVRRVIGEKTSREMIEILEKVVKEGTGKKAALEDVRVAGKTGTSQKVDPRTHQYTHERYLASFVGFAPASEARICVAVVLDEPEGAYYGGAVAAPVVGRIIQRGLVFAR